MRFLGFYTSIGGFILGAALFSWHPTIFSIIVAIFVLSVISAFFFRSTYTLLLIVVLVALVLGGTRTSLESLTKTTSLDVYVGDKVTLEGIVVQEPSKRETTTRITLEVERIEGEPMPEMPKIITSIKHHPQVSYGDRVRLEGRLEHPENFVNEQGRVFNYKNYLAKDAIFYTLSFPEHTIRSRGHGNAIKHALFSIKHAWLARIGELFPEPHASLLGGLVVGAKESLGDELEDAFRRTGIIHIVVLSGYNVTIVAEAMMRALSVFPYVFKLSFGVLAILFFAILTGASATIVRASIMAVIVLLARATGRNTDATHTLFFAAFIMVLHNPMIVLYDPSFQLSFLATVGLIHISPRIETYFALVPTRFQLREFAIATTATQLFVLPLLIYLMGEVSLVALPVNMLVLMFVPLTMLFGFLAGVLGFVHSAVALPFTLLTYVLLAYELTVVEWFSLLPFAAVEIPSVYFPLSLMVVFGLWYAWCVTKTK